MSNYSNLPVYNHIFALLKDLYVRIPKFSKEYKYLLGEKMVGCCIDCLFLINQISLSEKKEERLILLLEIESKMNQLLVYVRIANELNQLTKKDNYFFLSQKIVEILNQTENWKKFLQKKKYSQSCTSDGCASVDKKFLSQPPVNLS